MFDKFLQHRTSRVLVGGLAVSLIGAGGLAGTALWHRMDVPTYLASLQTPQVEVGSLQQGQIHPILLVDVRSPAEYTEDHIDQSVLVPLTDLQQGFGVEKIRAIAKNQPGQPQPTIVLYCHSGQRSVQAYQLLQATGLKAVVLKGGITRWRQQVTAAQDRQVLAAAQVISP